MEHIKRELHNNFPIEKLVPYDRNPKNHPPSQIKALAANMKRGWAGPPIIVDENFVIMAGHGRRLAALELELKSVPVLVVTGMSEEDKRLFRINDNRMGELGETNFDFLTAELRDLSFDVSELAELTAIDTGELDKLLRDFKIDEIDLNETVDNLLAASTSIATSTAEKIETVDAEKVNIDKVLGFKHVTVEEQRRLTRFMAMIEGATGKEGKDAFMDFAGRYLEGAAA
ncbi:ParB/Srx family N-terminal domain-containing protein [Chitinibacter tainanensis]|uniref:ParB/Srx family N-terminal domain-containing protein n=1 Tax=Chitinibacter tainanensis TaxID=230667 RepID=UPI0004904356|nr:ParB/Srx family N-terminal domain-containing protein [Chitinibacter tainanensis]